MDFSLGIQMDQETSTRILSGGGSSLGGAGRHCSCSSQSNHYHHCKECQNFTKLCNGRMGKKELRFAKEEELEKFEFSFSESELQLQKVLRIEHNTIDIINENMKLKELLKYAGSNLRADVDEARKLTKSAQAENKEIKEKLAAAQRELEEKSRQANEAEMAIAKKKKEYDELLAGSVEREKAWDEKGKYLQGLAEEREKTLATIELKDARIEELSKELFAKEREWLTKEEALRRQIADLEDEPLELEESLKNERIKYGELEKVRDGLARELEALNEELRSRGAGKAELEAAQMSLRLAREERDAARLAFSSLNERVESWKVESEKRGKDFEALHIELVTKSKQVEELRVSANNPPPEFEEVRKAKLVAERKVNESSSSLEGLKKELDELKRRLEDKDRVLEEKISKAGTAEKLAEQALAAQRAAESALEEKSNELAKVSRDKDAEITQKDKLAIRVKQLEQEILARKQAVDPAEEGASSRFAEEIAALNQKLKEAQFNTTTIERERSMTINDEMARTKKMEADLADLKKKLKDTESALAAARAEAKSASESLPKLRTELETANKARRSAEERGDELSAKAADLEKTIKFLKDEIEDKDREIEKLKKQLVEISEQLTAAKDDTATKQMVEGLKKEFAKQLRAILTELCKARANQDAIYENFNFEFNSMMNIENDDSRIKKIDEPRLGDLVKEMTGEIAADLEESYGEIERIENIKKNLVKELEVKTDENRKLEAKNEELQKRHDEKTDLVGKLTVKFFVLMTEMDRLSQAQAQAQAQA